MYEAVYNDYLEEYRNSNKDILEKHEQQKKSRFAFFGSETLISSYDALSRNYEKAEFNAKADYNYEKLYNELEEKIESKTLEYNVVIMEDDKLKLTNDELNKIVELCKDYKLYVCNVTDSKIENEDVIVIDFYSEMKSNDDYLMSDRKHLSKKGSEELANLLSSLT